MRINKSPLKFNNHKFNIISSINWYIKILFFCFISVCFGLVLLVRNFQSTFFILFFKSPFSRLVCTVEMSKRAHNDLTFELLEINWSQYPFATLHTPQHRPLIFSLFHCGVCAFTQYSPPSFMSVAAVVVVAVFFHISLHESANV